MRMFIVLAVLLSPCLGGELRGIIRKPMKVTAKDGDCVLNGDVLVAEDARLAVGPGTHVKGRESMPKLTGSGDILFIGKRTSRITVSQLALKGRVSATCTAFNDCSLELTSYLRKPSLRIVGCAFKNCDLKSGGGGLFEGCTIEGGAVGSLGPGTRGCRFAGCSVSISVLFAARACSFRNCDFTGDRTYHLEINRVNTTCTFDDASWTSLQATLGKTLFPKGKLLVKRKMPKKKP